MGKVINIHDAKTNFSRLVDRARAGERVVISKAGVPVAILGPLDGSTGQRRPGRDQIVIHPDFDDPLPEWDPEYSHSGDPLREVGG